MRKKILFISLILLGFVFAGMAKVYLTDVSASGEHSRTTELEQAKLNIMSIIQQNNFDEARAQFQNLIADFSGEPNLPEALYEIARQFEWRLQMEDANGIYQQIIQDEPDSSYASKAELGAARAEVLSAIILSDYSQSKEAIAQLTADYSNHPDFPETLYWVAERYRWAREYKEAKSIYKQIMQNYPDSTWAGEAKFGSSRVDVLSLINAGNYDQLEKAVAQMLVDFNDHPDLAVTLFNIARECEWMVKIKSAKSIYQKVIDSCPDSYWAEQAELGRTRVTVGGFIKQGDVNNAEPALDELMTDFNDNPDLAETLYWLAQRYQDVNSFEKTKVLYQEILQRWPDSGYAELIRIGIPVADIFSLIRAGKHDEGMEAIDKLIADFNAHPDLLQTLFIMGEDYYNKALQYEDEGLTGQAKANFTIAASVWDKIITGLPESRDITVQHSYYFVGACYWKLSAYDKTIQYWQKLLDDCPNYVYAWSAQCLIGGCFEKLWKSGNMSESEAKPLIEQAYKAVIEKYPNCSLVGHACLKLAEPLLQEGRWAEAAMYYELFLQKEPDDPRRADVLYDLGRTYEKLGETASAAQVYSTFIETAGPKDTRIKTAEAKLEELKGQTR